jgi:hypothetical protein
MSDGNEDEYHAKDPRSNSRRDILPKIVAMLVWF